MLVPWQILLSSVVSAASMTVLLLSRCCSVLLQVILLLAALAAVPVMLLPKPIILRKRAAARSAQIESYGRVSPQDPEDGADEHNGTLQIASASHHEEEFDFGEVAVHQVREAASAEWQGRWSGFPYQSVQLDVRLMHCLQWQAGSGCQLHIFGRVTTQDLLPALRGTQTKLCCRPSQSDSWPSCCPDDSHN